MNISEINIYPIKSLKGIGLSHATVEKPGLRFDRRWMLTDRNGMFFTQRETPKMATIKVGLTSKGLRVTGGGTNEIIVPFEPNSGQRQTVTVWGSTVEGEVYNWDVCEWFSEVLGRKCQLVLMPETAERHVSGRFDSGEDIVSFADGFPLLLIGEGSLEELNRRIPLDGDVLAGRMPAVQSEVPMERFRPNLVVRGSDPFAEDGWARIRVGEAIFRVVKPCARCVMTTIDQAKGLFDGREPLKTMATFRRARQVFPESYESYGQTHNAVLFGENLIPENPGVTIQIGDEVEVLHFRTGPR